MHALSTNDENKEDKSGIVFIDLSDEYLRWKDCTLPIHHTKRQRKLEKVRLRLTGYLLDLVNHHKGIRQAHLHRVIDRTDLWHLDGDLSSKKWSQYIYFHCISVIYIFHFSI